MQLLNTAVEQFKKTFGAAPAAAGIAPGRVEVLGNHTDYNEGFVLAAAIDRHTVVCGRAVDGETATVHAHSFDATAGFSVKSPKKTEENSWINYLAGVADQLVWKGVRLRGFEAVVVSNVPLGAGLSSSAALEVATAMFLQELFPYEMTPLKLARLCQAAENEFVGVNCGILDQFSSIMGKADHLIFLDCRDLDQFAHIPLGAEMKLVLAHTRAEHELADGVYNRLREDCFAAARYFDGKIPATVTHLRDVTIADYETHKSDMPDGMKKQTRHIVTENGRVKRAIRALKHGALKELGECLLRSHASSRDDFGNSCAELDLMVECARDLPGCYGARLSGGGFGGCTVNLVAAEKAEAFSAELARRYEAKTGIQPELHVCRAVDGARGVSGLGADASS